ncbi:hypothetical protein BGZ98_009589 [Dissophora globulifera]|nr:hypothetical protein BGZ98_009589 [Dissophora globulifera]
MNPLQVPELLNSICHQLDRSSLLAATQVSRDWHRICIPILWESCPFSAELYGAFHADFDNHAKLIRHLDAENRVIGSEMRFIAQQCTNLTSLTIQHCQVTPFSLDTLFDGIQRVHSLTFDLCRGVNSSSIASRLTRLPILTRLNIVVHTQERGNGDWRENDMALILTGCSLKYLKIVGPDLSHIHLLGVKRYAYPLPLVHLHLVSTFISETALNNLLGKSPHLLTLILLHNANKNSTVQVIADNCPNLRMLELKNSKSIATAAFDSVFKRCSRLISLNISYTLIYDAAISALTQHCPFLQVLDLSGCSRITHVAFLELMTTLACLQQLCLGGCTRLKIEAFSGTTPWSSRQTLEVLDISSVGICAESDSLDALVNHLGSLRRLRHLYLDEAVSQHPVMESFIASTPKTDVSIIQPAARPS